MSRLPQKSTKHETVQNILFTALIKPYFKFKCIGKVEKYFLEFFRVTLVFAWDGSYVHLVICDLYKAIRKD